MKLKKLTQLFKQYRDSNVQSESPIPVRDLETVDGLLMYGDSWYTRAKEVLSIALRVKSQRIWTKRAEDLMETQCTCNSRPGGK